MVKVGCYEGVRRAIRLWPERGGGEPELDILAFFAGRLGIVPEGKQRDVLTCGAKRVIVNCSRQWGKSTLGAGMALYRALTRAGCLVLVASPTERQSREFLRKVRALAERANGWRAMGITG